MAEFKNLIGLTLFPLIILAGIVVASLSRKIRDLFFLLLIVLMPMTQHLDVNFVSREWYRGTTRGFEFSILDILSFSLLFSLLLRPQKGHSRWFWPASLGLMIVFFLYCCISVLISDPQLFGFFELSKMLRGMIVFVAAALFVRSERELKLLLFGLCCAVCWQGGEALYQRYHNGDYRVTGIIGDPNSLSMYLCMVTPIFMAAMTSDVSKWFRRFCMVALLFGLVGVVLTISRAGVVAMITVLICAAIGSTPARELTPKRMFAAVLALLVGVGIFAKAWQTLESRYGEASLAQEYDTSKKAQGRGYYLLLARTIASDRWWGVGLNNWSYWVSNEYGPKLGWHFVPYVGTDQYPSDVVPVGRSNLDAAQAAPAHNLGALTLGELGIPGFIIFSVLWLRWFQMGASFLRNRLSELERRMGVGFLFACVGIFLQSLTEWVYRQTPINFTFNIILGAMASMYCLERIRQRSTVTETVEWEPVVNEEFANLSLEET